MASVVVAIDSTWDESTALATLYRASNVYPLLRKRGYSVEQLAGAHANQGEAEAAATAPGVIYLTGVSHGASDKFTGDHDRTVFETGGYDIRATTGKIIHFLSCNTALVLGRNLIGSGHALAFFGYIGAFAWPDASAAGGAAYAELFFACDAQIDLALAAGQTASAATLAATAAFNQQIQRLRKLHDPISDRVAAMLEQNRDMLRSPSSGPEYGLANAHLVVPQSPEPPAPESIAEPQPPPERPPAVGPASVVEIGHSVPRRSPGGRRGAPRTRRP